MAQAVEESLGAVPNLFPESDGGFIGAGSWAASFRSPAKYVGLWGEGGCVGLSNITSMLDSPLSSSLDVMGIFNYLWEEPECFLYVRGVSSWILTWTVLLGLLPACWWLLAWLLRFVGGVFCAPFDCGPLRDVCRPSRATWPVEVLRNT